MNQLASGFGEQNKKEVSSATQVEESKAMAEIQASLIMAQRFPRNENQCYMDIIDSCKRPFLAEQACYAYPRGSTLVTGPSIRLAEVLAQKWSNLKVGVKILSQNLFQTEAKAFAFDLQTNFMVEQEFVVPHKRTTRKGVTALTDERDIRELVANIGSRYLRGCILRLIPGDVVDAAVEQCKKTMNSSDVPIAEQIRKMIAAFDELGVKVEHLEKRLGHNLSAIIPQEIVTLKSIYKSIKDGMAVREDFFEISGGQAAKSAKNEVKAMLSSPSEEKSV